MADSIIRSTPKYPTKTTMNLAQHEQSQFELTRKTLVEGLLLILLVALFIKFGIVDLTSKASAANGEVADIQQQIDATNAQMGDYDKVYAEYQKYSYGYLDDQESSYVDRIDAIDLVESKVMSVGSVESITITDNTMSVTISGVTLEQVSALVSSLESSDMVADVTVDTASTQTEGAQQVSASLVITLQQPAQEGGQS